jgi:hypothetical protein
LLKVNANRRRDDFSDLILGVDSEPKPKKPGHRDGVTGRKFLFINHSRVTIASAEVSLRAPLAGPAAFMSRWAKCRMRGVD